MSATTDDHEYAAIEDDVFADLVIHAVSQFMIAVNMGLPDNVIYDNSPAFIQDIMELYTDRAGPSVTITEGGGLRGVAKRVIPSKCICKTMIKVALMTATFVALIKLRDSIGIDENMCFDVKQNTGWSGWLGTYVSARDNTKGKWQRVYCDSVLYVGRAISFGIWASKSPAEAIKATAAAYLLKPEMATHIWNSVKGLNTVYSNMTDMIYSRINEGEATVQPDAPDREREQILKEEVLRVITELTNPVDGLLLAKTIKNNSKNVKALKVSDAEDLVGRFADGPRVTRSRTRALTRKNIL